MSEKTRKRITTLVRVVLAVIFVAWAVQGVTYHDRVTLTAAADGDSGEPPYEYRLVEESQSFIVIQLDDERRLEVSPDQIAVDESGDPMIARGLASAIGQSDIRYIGLALLIFAPVPMLQSWRFMLLLRAQEIHLTYWECIKLSYGGNFLNFVFLLGTTAGDVFKAYYTALHTTRKTEAVTTILLDRIVGLVGLLLVAVVAMFIGSDIELLRQLRWSAVAFLAMLLVGAIMVCWSPVRRLLPARLMEKLPGWEQIKRIHGATDRLLRHKPLVVSAVLLAMVLQFIAIGAGVMCAYALHMDFSGSKVWDYFAYIGSGHVIATIPITPQGVGTMEGAYKLFFLGKYGTLSQLLCLALLLRFIQFSWSLPGALATLTGAYKPSGDQEFDTINQPLSPPPEAST